MSDNHGHATPVADENNHGEDHVSDNRAKSERTAAAEATSVRNTKKRGGLKAYFFQAFGIVAIIAVAFWWRSYDMESETTTKSSEQRTEAPRQSGEITTPEWEKAADDGSLPMNEWSKSIFPPGGSRTTFDAGNCVVYKVRYRLYNSAWMDHDCKSDPPATELQFMILVEGIKKVPITIIR